MRSSAAPVQAQQTGFSTDYSTNVNHELSQWQDHEAHQTKPEAFDMIQDPKIAQKKRKTWFWLIVLFVVAAIAIALAVGLGVGLTHHRAPKTGMGESFTSTICTTTLTSTVLEGARTFSLLPWASTSTATFTITKSSQTPSIAVSTTGITRTVHATTTITPSEEPTSTTTLISTATTVFPSDSSTISFTTLSSIVRGGDPALRSMLSEEASSTSKSYAGTITVTPSIGRTSKPEESETGLRKTTGQMIAGLQGCLPNPREDETLDRVFC